MITLTIRFFATYRERIGTDQLQIEVPVNTAIHSLLADLAEQYPASRDHLKIALVAINEEFAFATDLVKDGDIIAIFPPVSGGMPEQDYLAVTSDQLNIDRILERITYPETGAVCFFSGAVRAIDTSNSTPDTQQIEHLVYESYIPMAEAKLRQVADEIRQRFPKVHGIAIVQRLGKLNPGETTILVACSSGHRTSGCFEGARYGIDRVKEIVPVWKKEISVSNENWVEGHYRPTPADQDRASNITTSDKSISMPARVRCTRCNTVLEYTPQLQRCNCGGFLSLLSPLPFNPSLIIPSRASMWRYESFLTSNIKPISLGEGWTPLISLGRLRQNLYAKLEGLNPTGSFKDRGASFLVSALVASHIKKAHDDSSGNAATAFAAYSAYAGIRARLFVPATASPAKLGLIRLYDASLEMVDGPRSAAAQAAESFNDSDSYYASHITNPYSVAAYRTIAYEIWEQLDQSLPDYVILPAGHGTQLIGLHEGFSHIVEHGFATKVPRLIGVQSESCAPLAQITNTLGHPIIEGETLAEGIRIANPIRINEIQEAIQHSRGEIVTVSEHEIVEGMKEFGRLGIGAEPTSSVVWAAFKRLEAALPSTVSVVLSITGSAQKTPNLLKLLD
jgi:threonine synthase